MSSVFACGDGTIGYPHGAAGASGTTSGGSGTSAGSSGAGTTSSTTGGPNGGVGGCNPAQSTITGARVWRLTHSQLKNTLTDTFGFAGTIVDSLPEDSRLEGYANHPDGLGISSLLSDYYFRAADEIASQVIANPGSYLGCPLNALDAPCIEGFLNVYGAKAWRRPLADGERSKLVQLFTSASAASGTQIGLRMVVQGLVLSPNFLFRTELGDTQNVGSITHLTGYELASALSYAIWDGPPDAALLGDAATGKLLDPMVRLAQARRMLSVTTKTAPSLHSFVQQWLQIEKLPRVQKDPALFPSYSADVVQALGEETNRFVDSVVFDPGGDRSLKTLLGASYGFANGVTAPLYGVTATGPALAKVDLDPKQRRGLLTEGAFLAGHSKSNTTGLVGRGRFVRETVLCDSVPPPPGNFMFDPSVITDDMTERQKFEIHRKNAACASCHALFDPIGIALENYDPIGQYRTVDKGKPIDPSGKIILPNGKDLAFANYVDLLTQLGELPDVYDCFSSQYFQYATGRRVQQLDGCDAQTVAKTFSASGYKVDELVVAVVASASFAIRQN